MTQTHALELGALAALAPPQAPTARSKPHSGFDAAFERAERQFQESEAPAREVVRPEPEPRGEAATAQAEVRDTPAATAEAELASTEAGQAAQPRQAEPAAQAEASPGEASEAPAAEAAVPAVEPAVLTPELTLATLIATAPPAAPLATEPAAAAVATASLEAALGEALPGTAIAAASAQVAADAAHAAVTTGAASVDGAQPSADGAAGEESHSQGATPAAPPTAFAAAARGVGLTGVQVTTTPGPGEPTTGEGAMLANPLLAPPAEEAQPAQPQTGSITPVTVSDDGNAIEMPSPAILASEDGDAVEALAGTEREAEAGPTPMLNAERPAAEGPRAAGVEQPRMTAAARAEEVVAQVLKHADALKAQQQNSIKLQLYPEHLGKMEIRVVSHQGVLSAQLTADSQSVKAMLEGQVAGLQRSLQELGLKVDKVEVTLASADLGGQDLGGSAFADPQGRGSGQQGPHPQRLAPDTGYADWLADEPLPSDLGAWARGDSITAIDYVA